MRITRLFTTAGESPFSSIAFKRVDVEVCHADEAQRICIPDCEMPQHWSYEACEFLVRHYVRKQGVPAATRPVAEEGVPTWLCRRVADEQALQALPDAERTGSETSIVQVLTRLAGAWTYWGWKHDYFDTEADARAFFDEWCHLMAMQIVAPASPQWLNTGLHWAYGIEGDAQGHYHVDTKTGKVHKSENAYHHPQHHHCFIQSVRDELVSDGGIMSLWEREARLFKYGSGAGCNMSSIRAVTEQVSDGTPPVGLMRFVTMGNQAVGAIRAGVTAVEKLVVVDADHPEVEHFIGSSIQQQQEAAARITGAQQVQRHIHQLCEAVEQVAGESRFDPQYNSLLRQALADARRALIPEAYLSRVLDCLRQGRTDLAMMDMHHEPYTACASRMAVRVSDGLMHKAVEGQKWDLHGRCDGQTIQQVNAQAVMDAVAQAAWATGAPAMQFSDTVAAWHGCAKAGDIRASSPRGEYLFLDDTACDIATLNLLHFVDAAGEWQQQPFEHAVRLMVVMLDIAITMGQYPSRAIAANTYRYRPIGLSYCNLAAALMAMGYAYDSAEARAMAAAVTAAMTGAGYVASAELARELGAFEAFSENREGMMRLMWQHHEAALGRAQTLGREGVTMAALDHAVLPDQSLSDAVQRLWDLAMIRGDEYGYSNAQISLLASSPNVARLLDADALAAMPYRALVRIRALKEDAKERQPVPQMLSALRVLGYHPTQIDDVVRHVCGAATLKGAPAMDHDALLARGFTFRQITMVEQALAYVRHVRHAFDPFIVGEGFCRDVLRLNDWQMHDAAFDLLTHLGFDSEEIEAANGYACGAGNVCDAPHIREEDWMVFACMGQQVSESARVSVAAQLQMMAAIQPLISGGIAHHLMMPNNASIAACGSVMREAWSMGLKSVQLSRYSEEEQKSQAVPVISQVVAKRSVFKQQPLSISASPVEAVPSSTASVSGASAVVRELLPARRHGFTQKVTIEGEPVFMRTGEYPDGRLGEVFIDLPHQPETVRAFASQFAIAISVALQHGVPLEAFTQAFTASQFAPAGAVEGTASLTSASSISDYVFQELKASYGRDADAGDKPSADTASGAQILAMVRH